MNIENQKIIIAIDGGQVELIFTENSIPSSGVRISPKYIKEAIGKYIEDNISDLVIIEK